MATTVTYKGSTLTTATNQTKTLKTSGKYLEDDITITDSSAGGSAVVVTEETDAGGGIIKHITAVDLSNDTITADVLLSGYTAHNFQGSAITGTYTGGGTPINNQNKTVSPSTTQKTVTYDNGYTGLGTVTITAISTGTAGTPTATKGTVTNHTISVSPAVTNVTGYITGGTINGTAVTVSASELVNGTLSISANGTYDVKNYASASVNVSGGAVNNQNKSFTPDETGATLSADAGYTGLGTVTIAGISSTYVGTGVTRRNAANLTASGSVVTVPSGYYSSQVTKNISAGSAFPPAVTITTNPTVTIASATGLITATYTGSSSITPTVTAGYISQGTAGTISTTGTKTLQLTSKAAATYYTSTADQTIASSQWLIGVQTIKSVTYTGLTASTILSGTTVKIGDANNASRITQVAGTLITQNCYVSTATPASSLGANGDIYIKTS